MTQTIGRSLGPGAELFDDHFRIDGLDVPRRVLHHDGGLEPLERRRSRPDWDSQLDRLRLRQDLPEAVPRESEVFTYISSSMAKILRRIATVDTRAGEHRGFVLLFGPTGCGKTTTAKSYAWLANQPLTELSFSGDTTLTDFYRSVEVIRAAGGGQSTVTVPGPAVEAMLLGKKLLVNEINMVPADILVVFSQAMDTGRLVVSGTERGNVEIEVHRDFGIIGTANPNYVGTLEIGRAMERRFGRGLGYIEMTFIPPDEEAAAIVAEFDGTALFRGYGVRLDPSLARRLTELAAELRRDEQIGNVLINRLSTRALIHWAGLAAVTGAPLADVAERALFTTLPREARERAVDAVRRALGDARVAGAETLSPLKLGWPEARHAQALGLDTVRPAPSGRARANGRIGGEVVIHAVRYQKRLADGTRVLIGEPLHRHDGRRVALGLKLRAYDPDGRQIRDRWRLEEIERELRDVHGVNVPWRTGRPPTRTEALPCLTASSIQYLRLAEAALLLGRPVFFAGPTGSGKSSLARTLALLKGKRLVEFSLTGETAKGDLTASRRLVGGVTRWTTQAFLEALDRGDAVLINDYNVAYPDVHSLINGLFDKGASFTLPDGTRFRVHPDAWVIATGSLEGPGVKPLNEAVENRFGAIVAVDYPPVEEEVAILEHVAPGLRGSRVLENCVKLVDYCRQIATGRIDPATIVGLSRASQEALRQASRGAALSTAELVAIARTSRSPAEFTERFRTGVLEGASEAARRVLEPVLLQYGVE
ncbi:MAG TPA: AAA family ATPase [Chloroflexota bacterium]|nr:AAA family ATPase [Chloroflexota bacterium]